MKVFLFRNIFKSKVCTVFQHRTFSEVREPLHPLLRNFDVHSKNTAVADPLGSYRYSDILSYSRCLAQKMREKSPTLISGGQKTVSFLCANDVSYICTLLACWMNNSIAVPLCKEHPPSLHEYFLNDSRSTLAVCTLPFIDQIQPLSSKLSVPLLVTEHPASMNMSSSIAEPCDNEGDYGAVIIYTSGTTGPPKGVLLTHNNLHFQVSDIVKTWNWKSDDSVLNVLPLHHVHGLLYCVLCSLAIGAKVVMMPKFNALEVWKHFLNIHDSGTKVNMFSAVPTVYTKLIQAYEELCQITSLGQDEIKERCKKNIRLMVAGSSALPNTVFHEWQKITGHVILERYGMSEIGMALSNSLMGERIPGSVGLPPPQVRVRIVKELHSSANGEYEILVQTVDGKTKVAEGKSGESGELHIKGPNVFKEYWNKPDATKKEFTKDGWFKTGDVATYENGVYRILGRASSDIIKTGGYKVSALDVERYLLEHPAVSECTVFGVPDEEWGEIISAVVGLRKNKQASASELKEFCKTKLPHYSVPQLFKFVDSIPRNITGKVNKKELREKLKEEFKAMLKKH